MAKSTSKEAISAEEKIKAAARKVFTQKGYAATRTRDIVEEAGLNIALLNYYFRSKEKLFEIIMLEKMQEFFGIIIPFLHDETTTLDKKIEQITNRYIDMLLQNPDMPIFVLSEIRNNNGLFKKIQVGKILQSSHFVRQLKEKQPGVQPLHFIASMLGMIIFPFVSKPVFKSAGVLNEHGFATMMEERKKLLPKWIKAMLGTK
ncbi:MAG: TetR/AcrR family transcriptional regulator [Chitinophagaceae bacterium]|nr:TetR/AcrR family transcriptional regulator [Chitinophagaceae bacterium]